jgi:hypothetical protein
MKRYITVILISLTSILANGSQTNLTNNSHPSIQETFIKWDKATHCLLIDQTKIHIGIDAIFGYYTNEAQYASYGLETQIFKYSKIVVPISINYKNFFASIDFAPFYDSIKAEEPLTKIPPPTPNQQRNIYINFDWYKNLGTRNYYLGRIPIIEAYAGYQPAQHHKFTIGRIKNEVGLTDSITPWSDDGLFSPMSYWLSRDLYSGIAYLYESNYVNLNAKVFSGNNPMKGYANYLNHIQTPNLKANNTGSYSLNIDINVKNLLNLDNKINIIFGIIKNTLSSTWNKTILPKPDGKRRNDVYAVGTIISLPINDAFSAEIFSQYTWYLSGLSEASNQNDYKNNRFRDITQSGYFIGTNLIYKDLSIAYTYENFDRFDSNIYDLFLNNHIPNKYTLKALQDLKQSSHIISIKYVLNNYTSININYHHIYNPLKWTSYIMDSHQDCRFSLTLHIKFD